MYLKRGYKRVYKPDHPRAGINGQVYEHTLIAEKALDKLLPKGVEVHHYGKKTDNTKLVICQDQAYHKLLHQRMRAFKACGHAYWRKCQFCKQYDDTKTLYINGNTVCHEVCKAAYMKEYYEKNKAKIAVKRRRRYQRTKK